MKQHQLLALANGAKQINKEQITAAYQQLKKRTLFDGMNRVYQPKDEEGDTLPPESNKIQQSVPEVVRIFRDAEERLISLTASINATNVKAKGNIPNPYSDSLLGHDVPVTTLIFLEKELINWRTFITSLPTLDPSVRWHYEETTECYVSEEVSTTRTKKVPTSFVKYEATREHPAQVEVFHEDHIVGTWTKTDRSAAIPASEKTAMLQRVNALIDTVKVAREEANSIEVVQDNELARELLDYVFEGVGR